MMFSIVLVLGVHPHDDLKQNPLFQRACGGREAFNCIHNIGQSGSQLIDLPEKDYRG